MTSAVLGVGCHTHTATSLARLYLGVSVYSVSLDTVHTCLLWYSTSSPMRVVPSSWVVSSCKSGKLTRGHDFTLANEQSRLDVRKFSLSQRTVHEWNKYCQLIVITIMSTLSRSIGSLGSHIPPVVPSDRLHLVHF